MKELIRFREVFWDAFHRPKLSTEKVFKVWNSLESINDLLAGPFYSIFENGNCNFVFNDKNRFPQISVADDFFNWNIELIELYKDAVEAVEVENEEEIKDKEILLYQIDLKMELADLSFSILRSYESTA